MRTLAIALTALALNTAHLGAQDSTRLVVPDMQPRIRPSWFTRHDFAPIGLAVAGVALASTADQTIAQHLQRPSLHSNRFLGHSANAIEIAGDPGALVTSVAMYAIASASKNSGLADAGKHSLESIIASGAITQALKLSIGRARPNVSHDQDAFAFHPFHGQHEDYNSFPSGHTTAAFAAAAAFSAELHRTHPEASRWASPAMYGVATLVGGARMYNNRHWLSDVAAGAIIGQFVARRIVKHAHG
jgi:membrane-associated phospholipid phosphatase